MRQILFRGLRTDGKGWLYGLPAKIIGDWYVIPEEGYDSPDNYKVNPETIGQFTGEIDDAGNAIFEGDQLNATRRYSQDGYTPVVVCFDLGSFDLYWDPLRTAMPGVCFDSLSRAKTNQCALKVIGNIHEGGKP
jgi:hypothetical protein